MTYVSIHCPKCDRTFKQEARLLDHLTDDHGIADHCTLFINVNCGGVHPKCACSPSCDQLLPWAGWKKGFTSKYARGHNARVFTAFSTQETIKKAVASRVEGFQVGRNKVWNKGLTKHDDDRVALSAISISQSLNEGYSSGRLVDWRVNDPEKARIVAQKSSETKKKGFASGRLVPWNKRLSKMTDARVAGLAASIKQYKQDHPETCAGRFSELAVMEWVTKHAPEFDLITDPKEYRNKYQHLEVKCKECGRSSHKTLAMLRDSPVCYLCHPQASKGQLELYEFVKSLCPDAVLSDRTVLNGKELDVWVPSKRVGIEFDGLYWHSVACESGEGDRSSAKLRLADLASIKYAAFFEDEWRDKRPIVESIIRHRLGMTVRRVGARSCRLVELEVDRRRQFFDANHLEGDVSSKAGWGLIDSYGQLIAALSVRRPFHQSHASSLEVGRFCCMNGVSVPGALARLVTRARQFAYQLGFDSLMTYVDRRVGDGHGYVSAGFDIVATTAPRFWWTDFVDRFDRFSVRANKVRGITQKQAAQDRGVTAIHGCPNLLLKCKVN